MEMVLNGSQRKTEQNIPQSINHSLESQQMTSRNITASVQDPRHQSNGVSEKNKPPSGSTQKNKTGIVGYILGKVHKLQAMAATVTFITKAALPVCGSTDFWLRCDKWWSLL
jgi:hypothetical protein